MSARPGNDRLGGLRARCVHEPAERVDGLPSGHTPATAGAIGITGKGWIVDGDGGVDIPAGTWTFQVNVRAGTNLATSHLAVGMWKVNVTGSPGTITSSQMLLDPGGAGEQATPNTLTTGTTQHMTSFTATVNAFSLATGEHLYIQLYRHQTATTGGQQLVSLLTFDGTGLIKRPSFPNLPALSAVGPRLTTAPTLSATFSDPDAADTGTLQFQLCSDVNCNTVLQSHTTSSGISNGSNGTWSLPALSDGAYYWRAQSTDNSNNLSGWSSTSSFIIDTTPPGTPTLDSPSAGARVNTTLLGATFVDSDLTDSGTVTFQLCGDASCSTVLAHSTSAAVSGGTSVSWTPGGLADGTYYWDASAQDVAGNQGASSAVRSFVLDTNPPGTPSLTSPADASYLGAVPALSATFSSSDVGDSGTVNFRVCSDSGCTTLVQSGSSAGGLLNGVSGSWTPSGLPDGTYYWQASAVDTAGNQSARSAIHSFTVDTVPPTVSGVTASNLNGAYNAGQTIHVQVAFSEPVNVTGSPKLALNTTPAESATYASGSGSSTLTFDYTVQAGDNVATLDYNGTGALTLNGGTIADPAGNNATLTLASPGAAGSLAANKSIAVDTVAPTVTNVISSPVNYAYKAGTTVPVTVSFSEPVTVDTSGGTPSLALSNGATATYASGSGGANLTFNYTVSSGDTNTTHLAYAATSSLALNGATIRDAATNNATLTLPSPGSPGSLDANATITIDTVAPTVSSVTASNLNGAYKAGQTIHVQVAFSEPVNVTGSPKLALNTTPAESATYASGSGSSTLTFDYTVQSRRQRRHPRLQRHGRAHAQRRHDRRPGRQQRDPHPRLARRGRLTLGEQEHQDRHQPARHPESRRAGRRLLSRCRARAQRDLLEQRRRRQRQPRLPGLRRVACSSVVRAARRRAGSPTARAAAGRRAASPTASTTGAPQAQDAAGNQSALVAPSQSFTLDTTAPSVPPLGTVAARAQDDAAALGDLRRPARLRQRHACFRAVRRQRLRERAPEPHGERGREQHGRRAGRRTASPTARTTGAPARPTPPQTRPPGRPRAASSSTRLRRACPRSSRRRTPLA